MSLKDRFGGRPEQEAPVRERPQAFNLPRTLRDYINAQTNNDEFHFDELAETNPYVMQAFRDFRTLFTHPDPERAKFIFAILDGPTGTGKTSLVGALATECGPYAEFERLTPADFLDDEGNMTVQSVESRLRKVAERAVVIENEDEDKNRRMLSRRAGANATNRKYIICIEEGEGLFYSTSPIKGELPPTETQRAITNRAKTLLEELARRNNLMLIVNTNNSRLIDKAIVSRAGTNIFEMSLPTKKELPALFALYIKAAANQFGNDIFDPELFQAVQAYRDAAEEVYKYQIKNSAQTVDQDGKLKKLSDEQIEKAKALNAVLTDVTSEAEGLSPRDVAMILEKLANRVYIQQQEAKAAEKKKMAYDVQPVRARDIKQEIVTFKSMRSRVSRGGAA